MRGLGLPIINLWKKKLKELITQINAPIEKEVIRFGVFRFIHNLYTNQQ